MCKGKQTASLLSIRSPIYFHHLIQAKVFSNISEFWNSFKCSLPLHWVITSMVNIQETGYWLVSVVLNLSADKKRGERKGARTIKRGTRVETGIRRIDVRHQKEDARVKQRKTEGGRFCVDRLKADTRNEKGRGSSIFLSMTGFCRRTPTSSEKLSYMLRGSENCSSRCSEPSWLENIHLHLTGKDPADAATCTDKARSTPHTHTHTGFHSIFCSSYINNGSSSNLTKLC